MQKLFVYGTLKDQETQIKIIGRELIASPDSLEGYEISNIEIEGDTYPILIEKEGSTVSGEVLEVSDIELKKIDEYETSAYRRVSATLNSGTTAWVYIK